MAINSVDAQFVKPTGNQVLIFITGEASDRPVSDYARCIEREEARVSSSVRPPE
jgi:hypothetical protein